MRFRKLQNYAQNANIIHLNNFILGLGYLGDRQGLWASFSMYRITYFLHLKILQLDPKRYQIIYISSFPISAIIFENKHSTYYTLHQILTSLSYVIWGCWDITTNIVCNEGVFVLYANFSIHNQPLVDSVDAVIVALSMFI